MNIIEFLIPFCSGLSGLCIFWIIAGLVCNDVELFKPYLLKKRYRENSVIDANIGETKYRIVRSIPTNKATKEIKKYLEKRKRNGLTEISILLIAKDINLPIQQISDIVFSLEREDKLVKL